MKLTRKQYAKIEHLIPKQRKKSTISNYDFVCALLYIIENGCKQRALPKEFGDWHTIYVRFNYWSKKGTIDRIEEIQNKNIIDIKTEIVCIDSTTVKNHPDAAGARKSCGEQSIGRSKKGLTAKIHSASASAEFALAFHLSLGNNHDAPEGRILIRNIFSLDSHSFLMDCIYEDKATRQVAIDS